MAMKTTVTLEVSPEVAAAIEKARYLLGVHKEQLAWDARLGKETKAAKSWRQALIERESTLAERQAVQTRIDDLYARDGRGEDAGQAYDNARMEILTALRFPSAWDLESEPNRTDD